MYGRKAVLILGAMIAVISAPAFAQTETGDRNEVTVQAFGSFLKSTTDGGVRQDATNSGGVLATYGFFFNKHNGVEVNYGYSRDTQSFYSNGGSAGVRSDTHELSAEYVFRYPLKHWVPFALAGTGGLVFDPVSTPGIGSQARAAFVYGGGADLTLTAHLYLRAEYRGFVYNSPTYNLVAVDGTERITHLAEPSIGFGWRF